VIFIVITTTLLFALRVQIERYEGLPIPADCMDGGKLLGYPSPDNRIRLYDQEACSTLGGNHIPNGECLGKEGGSFSWDCRDMPPVQPPVQTMEIQPSYMNSEIVLSPYNVMHIFNQGSCAAIGGNFLPTRRYTNSYSIR
jgi:hypothetical protein